MTLVARLRGCNWPFEFGARLWCYFPVRLNSLRGCKRHSPECPVAMRKSADSGGRRNTGAMGRTRGVYRAAGRGSPQPRILRGRVLKFGGDAGQLGGGMHAQVRALGKYLAQQPVRVLVGAPLPRAGPLAEVDRDVRGSGISYTASPLQ